MPTIRTLLSLVLLPVLVACPETPCEDAFDCAVGESCLADGTCAVVAPEPDPEPNPQPDPPVDAGPLDAGFDAGPLDAGFDAGPLDAGFDAGPLDAGFDAGPLDAGFDAGPLDAGFDAGPLDAGFDAGPLPIQSISAFDAHACVLLLDGRVRCWGRNPSGQLGLGDTDNRGDDETIFPTVNLGVGRTAVSIAVGARITCAILDDGAVKCWGYNFGGELGIGDIDNRGDDETIFPTVNLGAGRTAVAIAAGDGHTCVILDDGSVKCWGNNSRGQLGVGTTETLGDTETQFATVNLGAGRAAISLATGFSHTCVLLDDGSVKCWGNNSLGQLGIGTTENMGDNETDFVTVNLGVGRTATAIASGGGHTCAILDDGALKCWGANGVGQLGIGDANDRGDDEVNFPTVNLGAGRTASSIGAGMFHTCVVLDDGAVKCWGENLFGKLGLGDTETRGDDETVFPDVDLGAGLSAHAIAAGRHYTCAVVDNGGVKCWGGNSLGMLGLGDTDDRGGSANQMGDALPFVSVE